MIKNNKWFKKKKYYLGIEMGFHCLQCAIICVEKHKKPTVVQLFQIPLHDKPENHKNISNWSIILNNLQRKITYSIHDITIGFYHEKLIQDRLLVHHHLSDKDILAHIRTLLQQKDKEIKIETVNIDFSRISQNKIQDTLLIYSIPHEPIQEIIHHFTDMSIDCIEPASVALGRLYPFIHTDLYHLSSIIYIDIGYTVTHITYQKKMNTLYTKSIAFGLQQLYRKLTIVHQCNLISDDLDIFIDLLSDSSSQQFITLFIHQLNQYIQTALKDIKQHEKDDVIQAIILSGYGLLLPDLKTTLQQQNTIHIFDLMDFTLFKTIQKKHHLDTLSIHSSAIALGSALRIWCHDQY